MTRTKKENPRNLAFVLSLSVVIFLSFYFNLGNIRSMIGLGIVQAVTPTPLMISGHKMYNSYGEIVLRGFGRLHDMDDASGWWSGAGEPFLAHRWESNMATVADRVQQNLVAMRSWGANMIRLHISFGWWWNDIVNPAQDYGQAQANYDLSYRNYLKLVINEAMEQGFYVVICPYCVDLYETEGTSLPIPLRESSFVDSFMTSIAPDTTNIIPWKMWWDSISSELGVYPNVIFETWNEPLGGATPINIKSQWRIFEIEMYKTVRENCNNVILFTEEEGTVPNWSDELTWVPLFYDLLKADIGGEPINISFDFHCYRFNWNLGWATTNATVRTQMMSQNMLGGTRSNGYDLHVGSYEMGCALSSSNMDNEMGWYTGILKVFNEEGVPYNSYFWYPMRSDIVPVLSMIQDPTDAWWASGAESPRPSISGQVYINTAIEWGAIPSGGDDSVIPDDNTVWDAIYENLPYALFSTIPVMVYIVTKKKR